MALTSVVLAAANTKPKDVAYATITGTADGQGIALTLSTTAPETGAKEQYAEIIPDAACFWSYQDGQTAATGTMTPLLAYQPLRVEVTAAGLNLYFKTTCKLAVVQV